jgi:cellulose synthase/poly-beta-1,6-N-acetylglucosamine synthase-like glycosyltransferase
MHTAIENVTAAVTMGALTLNAWHHVGWPVAMKAMSRLLPVPRPVPPVADAALPLITVVMPAYNEAEHIAAKLRNIAAQYYPANLLTVLIACDGCTDATVTIARQTLSEPGCAHLNATVIDHVRNRGKVAVLNGTISTIRSEVVVLTDVSAMLPADALRRTGCASRDRPARRATGNTRSR